MDADTVDLVRALARRRARGWRVDADDLAQEGLLAVWLADAEHPALVTVIAKRAMIDYVRRERGRIFPCPHGHVYADLCTETPCPGPRMTAKRAAGAGAHLPLDDFDWSDRTPITADIEAWAIARATLDGARAAMTLRDHSIVCDVLVGGWTLAEAGAARNITEARVCQIMGAFRRLVA